MVSPYSRIGTGEQLRRVDERKMLEAVSERRPQISGHSGNNCYEEVCHRFGEMKNVVREEAISRGRHFKMRRHDSDKAFRVGDDKIHRILD